MNQEQYLLPECPLSDTELIERSRKWVSDLCRTGAKAWVLRVPVDLENDPDVLFNELGRRLSKKDNRIEKILSDFILKYSAEYIEKKEAGDELAFVKKELLDSAVQIKNALLNNNPFEPFLGAVQNSNQA